MPDTILSSYAAPSGTASPQITAPAYWATLALKGLQGCPVAMSNGPTGVSVYWPEAFAVVHPDLATTDAGFNRVDEVWVHGKVTISIFADPFATSAPPLAEAVQTIRDGCGLPAADVAAMVGVRRRQLYNLLNGESASSERERWIGTLAEQISTLRDAAGDDPRRVRAAILLPGAGGRSLYDLACERDEDALRRVSADLARELRAGRISGRVQRPSPTLRGRGSNEAVHDFLTGYRDADEQD